MNESLVYTTFDGMDGNHDNVTGDGLDACYSNLKI